MGIPVGKWSFDLYNKMSNLCIGTCLLAPSVATPMLQRNDQKKKDKRTNNDLQNMHIKLKID